MIDALLLLVEECVLDEGHFQGELYSLVWHWLMRQELLPRPRGYGMLLVQSLGDRAANAGGERVTAAGRRVLQFLLVVDDESSARLNLLVQ